MKIAITALAPGIDSEMDPRVGRARYIVIVDPDGSVLEVIDNATNMDALRGAGIQTSKMLADRKVDVLITGHCGPNAFRVLNAAGIKVAVGQSGTVQQALERFNRNDVTFTDGPNVA